MHNHSVRFFDSQFQRQVAAGDFEFNPFEIKALDYLRGKVLDLGAGLGNLSLEAGRRGHDVLALDASPTAVDRINRDAQAEQLPVRAEVADLAGWRSAESFDTVLMIGLLSYFPPESAYDLLASAMDCTAPKGRLVVNVLIKGTTYMGMFAGREHYLFPVKELRDRFLGWKLMHEDEESFDAPDGLCKNLLTIIAEKPAAT